MVVKERLGPNRSFRIHSNFKPSGDQPNAIKELVSGINSSERNQVLLGATGTGKTFTIAHVIEQTQRPAVILAPNKTLAAQLYGEFKTFFPDKGSFPQQIADMEGTVEDLSLSEADYFLEKSTKDLNTTIRLQFFFLEFSTPRADRQSGGRDEGRTQAPEGEGRASRPDSEIK